MYCSQCGSTVDRNAKFCSSCGVALSFLAGSEANPNDSSSSNAPLNESIAIRPWVRYWARMVDLYAFSITFVIVLIFVAPHYIAGINEYVLAMISVFFWIFVEAVLLTSFQTTPGKWLLKTKIALKSEKSIDFSTALARSFKVWWRGIGGGIPLASVITMIAGHDQLTKNRITSWDRDGDFNVTHEAIGIPRVVLTIAFFGAMVVLPRFLS